MREQETSGIGRYKFDFLDQVSGYKELFCNVIRITEKNALLKYLGYFQ